MQIGLLKSYEILNLIVLKKNFYQVFFEGNTARIP